MLSKYGDAIKRTIENCVDINVKLNRIVVKSRYVSDSMDRSLAVQRKKEKTTERKQRKASHVEHSRRATLFTFTIQNRNQSTIK